MIPANLILDAVATQSTSPVQNPTPVTQPQPPQQQPKVPLWRLLLGSALIGLSGARGARDLADAAAGGSQAYQDFQDRQFQREQITQKNAADIAKTNAETAETQARIPLITSQTQLADAQAALVITNKLHLEKLIAAMPAEEQRKWEETQAQYITALAHAGMQAEFSASDDPDTLTSVQQQYPDAFRALLPVHDRSNNRVLFFRKTDAMPRFPKDEPPIKLPDGTTIKIAGLPIAAADAVVHGSVTIRTAEIAAVREATRKQVDDLFRLSMKEALAQARLEVNQLAQSEQMLPPTKRTLKSPDDIAQAVNRRAVELMNLSAQLAQAGVQQPHQVLPILVQLQTAKKNGATELDLKKSIAAALAQGQIEPGDAVTLYDQLGISPGTQPTPSLQLQPSHTLAPPSTIAPNNESFRTPGSGSSSIQ